MKPVAAAPTFPYLLPTASPSLLPWQKGAINNLETPLPYTPQLATSVKRPPEPQGKGYMAREARNECQNKGVQSTTTFPPDAYTLSCLVAHALWLTLSTSSVF